MRDLPPLAPGLDRYSVLFADGRQAVFPPPADPQHPASQYWESAEALAVYFGRGADLLDAEDQVVAIMPALVYP